MNQYRFYRKLPLLIFALILSFLGAHAQYPPALNETGNKKDIAALSKLNAQFVNDFINNDTVAHSKIIHKDFVCIDSKGAVINRNDYMQDWLHGYDPSIYKHFDYTSEFIRVIGNTGLIRAITRHTILVNGKEISGKVIYTDTYVKENGNWHCIQAQLTSIK